MPRVFKFYNPFDRSDFTHTDVSGSTLREIVSKVDTDFPRFKYPTIIVVDGEARLQARWDENVPDSAQVSLIRLPTGAGLIIGLIIAVVAVVVTAVTKQNPAAVGVGPKDIRNGSPVYTLSGEKNQVRLGDAIECVYGRNRLYPAYAAIPYSTYEGNQQYQHALFCLGHGAFSIHSMAFEDTPLQNFDDVEYEIVKPGESFELFSDNVETSTEVAGIELFGPNEEEYTGPTNEFIANEAYTLTTKIEVDVALPGGLYKLDEDGDLDYEDISVSFHFARIDDNGKQLGGWSPLTFSKKTIKTVSTTQGTTDFDAQLKTTYETVEVPYFYKRLKTLTPQRFSLSRKVPAGRYKVRAIRTNARNKTTQAMDLCQWEGLKAYFPSTQNYGDVTLIAVRARASNNLNNDAASRFNVTCTRILPTWTANGGWVSRATRNPVWAFCDIFRARYGGKLPASLLNLTALSALATQLNGVHFDHIFDTTSTVWEAARTVGYVGRGTPMLSGSQITLLRDDVQTIPKAVFNLHNIVEGSFTWSLKMNEYLGFDGVEVEYIDGETWKPATVVCLLDNDAGTNLEPMRLLGCTNRDQAYQAGLYYRATQRSQREVIEFVTGLEGFLPAYGDLILVSHDVPRWGVGGTITAISGSTLTLSEPVTFTPGKTYQIYLRKRDGSAHGPLTVTEGPDEFRVVLSAPLSGSLYYLDDTHERPYFIFGESGQNFKACQIIELTPEGTDQVRVRAVNYDTSVFSYANVKAPPLGVVRSVKVPARPVVSALSVWWVPSSADFLQLSWPPALGAKNYVLEQSEDGIHWVRIVTSPDLVHTLRVEKGVHHFRVAGVNVDIGPWVYWQGTAGAVSSRPATVANLRFLTDGPGYNSVTWDAQVLADSYEVYIYDDTTLRLLRRVVVLTNSCTYTLAEGLVDGLSDRRVRYRVKAMNIRGLSITAAFISQLIPELPTPLALTTDSTTLTTDAQLPKTDHH